MNYCKHFLMLHSFLKYAGMFQIVEGTQEAVKLALRFRIKSEYIGGWLYCFTSPLIGYQLEAIGFWYSFKHNAYIYSGNPKDGVADDETLEEIRSRLGSYRIN